MASCVSCFWSMFWLLVLFFIGWPLSITIGGIYVLVAPLLICLCLDQLSNLLLQGTNLGRTCAYNMKHGKPFCYD